MAHRTRVGVQVGTISACPTSEQRDDARAITAALFAQRESWGDGARVASPLPGVK